MSDPQLRLTVYRESVGLPRLRWPCDVGEKEAPTPTSPERADGSEWHEEVYEWNPGREQVVQSVATKLTTEFNESLPRERRRPLRLQEVARSLMAEVSGEWSVSMDQPRVTGREQPPCMTNASAALVQQLNWIGETFADLPGAHIVVR